MSVAVSSLGLVWSGVRPTATAPALNGCQVSPFVITSDVQHVILRVSNFTFISAANCAIIVA